MPLIAHESLGVDCCGCLTVEVKGAMANLVCNECGELIRTVPLRRAESTLMSMLRRPNGSQFDRIDDAAQEQ